MRTKLLQGFSRSFAVPTPNWKKVTVKTAKVMNEPVAKLAAAVLGRLGAANIRKNIEEVSMVGIRKPGAGGAQQCEQLGLGVGGP